MDGVPVNNKPPLKQRSSLVRNYEDDNPQTTPEFSKPTLPLKPSIRSTASTVSWASGDSSTPSSSSSISHRGSFRRNDECRRTAKEFLMVFYAAPLVYEDEKTRLIKPIGALDFKMEHNALKQSLEGTELDVMFDYATTDRVSKFLIEGRGRVLHYSGHGHAEYLVDEERWGEQYLAIENGRGKMHKLTVEDLEDWIKQGGNNLELVFVSACHSRAAGEAFVKAGVKHVVCCAHDEFEIRNDAAVEFTKAFYQALANGRTVAKAFEDGRSKVKTSSQMARAVAHEEGEKFVLLPVDQNHDVMIYDLDQPPASPSRLYTHDEMQLMGEKDRGTLPRPPDFFQGRQLEMYDVLSKLEKTRIVRITGSEGIGKRSVVNALCHYILDRQHIFKGFIDHLVWLPVDFETGKVDCRPLMDDVNQEMLVQELSVSSYLLMIDARCCSQLQFVEEFLRLIISHTSTRIIVIERFENPGCLRLLPGLAESEVHIAPLDFQETAWLFGSHCPLVCNGNNSDVKCAKDFRSAVIPQDATVGTLHTMIGREYYKELGGGYPKVIQERAKNMKDDHAYRRLLQLGRKHKKIVEWMQELQLYSRAQLDKMIEDTQKQKKLARSRWRLEEADTWSKKLNELEALKERFPTIESLTRKSRELKKEIQLAFDQEDYITANTLSAAHIRVKHKLQTERLAIKNSQRIDPAMSHRKLQQKVESLKFNRRMALKADDLDMAESLQNDLNRYKKLLAAKPSLAFHQELKARRLEEYETARDHAANDDELGDISHLRELSEKLKEAFDRENAELFAQSHDNIVNDMTWYETVERCATLWQSSGNASTSEESESTLTTPQADEHLAKAAPLPVATGFGSMAHCVGSMKYGCLKPTPISDRGNGDYGHSKQLNDAYQREQHGIPQFSHTVTNTRNPQPQDVSHSFDSSNPFRGDKEEAEVSDSKPTHWKDRMAMEGSDRTKYLDVYRPGQESPSATRWSKSDILFEPSTKTPLTFGNKSEESLPAVMPTVKPEPSSQHSETSNSKSVGRLIPSQTHPPSQTLINTKPHPITDVLVQNAKFPASKSGESSSGGNKKKTKTSGCNPTGRIPSPTKTLESDLKPPPATAVIFQNAEQPVSNLGDSNSVCTANAACAPSPSTLQRASDKLADLPLVPESKITSRLPARTLINLPSDSFNHSYRLNRNPGKVLGLEMSGVEEAPSRKDLRILTSTIHPNAEAEHERILTSPHRIRKDPPGTHNDDQAAIYCETASLTPHIDVADRPIVPTPNTKSAVALLGHQSSRDLIADNGYDSKDEFEKKPAAKVGAHQLYHVRVPDLPHHHSSLGKSEENQEKVGFSGVAGPREKVASREMPPASLGDLESEALRGDKKGGQATSIDSNCVAVVRSRDLPGAHCVPGINNSNNSSRMLLSSDDDEEAPSSPMTTTTTRGVPVAAVLDSEARTAEIDNYLQGMVLAEAVPLPAPGFFQRIGGRRRSRRFKKAIRKVIRMVRKGK